MSPSALSSLFPSSTTSDPDYLFFYLKLMFWNLLLAVIGCLLVVVVEPAAAGSGIDHVILH